MNMGYVFDVHFISVYSYVRFILTVEAVMAEQ